mmetsp:Transcript_9314/g.13224  ORF Transcript_9314/g.13224 Transcript_9314/m.13224 type:complete len:251 (+) Transcript_9314:3-755(+)
MFPVFPESIPAILTPFIMFPEFAILLTPPPIDAPFPVLFTPIIFVLGLFCGILKALYPLDGVFEEGVLNIFKISSEDIFFLGEALAPLESSFTPMPLKRSNVGLGAAEGGLGGGPGSDMGVHPKSNRSTSGAAGGGAGGASEGILFGGFTLAVFALFFGLDIAVSLVGAARRPRLRRFSARRRAASEGDLEMVALVERVRAAFAFDSSSLLSSDEDEELDPPYCCRTEASKNLRRSYLSRINRSLSGPLA